MVADLLEVLHTVTTDLLKLPAQHAKLRQDILAAFQTIADEQLRPVKSIVDSDRMDEGVSLEEALRTMRLPKILITKDPCTESRCAVERAISVIEQIGTVDAIKLL
jgi:hypothetical protein